MTDDKSIYRHKKKKAHCSYFAHHANQAQAESVTMVVAQENNTHQLLINQGSQNKWFQPFGGMEHLEDPTGGKEVADDIRTS